MRQPDPKNTEKMQRYAEKFAEKSGTHLHPDVKVTEGVVLGLAANIEEIGRPLCPCNFYPDKKAELEDNGRRWVCACDEMQIFKYCHCLLFVREDGMPITEHLPEGHEGLQIYGKTQDPTPDQGRAMKHKAAEYIDKNDAAD